MITRNSVNKVLETAKIEEVIGDYVTLKRSGSNFIGLCPFHNEKTPSFHVHASKGIFKCFGCGKSGDVVRFVMEHQQQNFTEAIRTLAKRYNIALEERTYTPEEQAEQHLLDSLYIINDYAKTYYTKQLWDTQEGQAIGLSYFKQRGFLDSTIRKFELGFAPPQGLLGAEAKKAQHDTALLTELGLITQSGRDFFFNRTIFPIHNLSGKVVAFAGRQLAKDNKSPKYINSPESKIYQKSKLVYGIFQARPAIGKLDECLLVEGYTDVITLHQAGIENVVASSGTALTVDQLKLIKRFTQNLTIIYDGDSAGVKAALRGLDLALEVDLNVRMVLLPTSEDPDSYLQKVGSDAFRLYVKNEAVNFISFKARLLMTEAGNDPIKHSEAIRSIVGSVAKVPDPIKQAIYVRELSHIVQLTETVLMAEVNKIKRAAAKIAQEAALRRQEAENETIPGASAGRAPQKAEETSAVLPLEAPLSKDEFQERDVIRVLLQYGEEFVDAQDGITVAANVLQGIAEFADAFENEAYKTIVAETKFLLQQQQPVTSSYFLTHADYKVSEAAMKVLESPWVYSPEWELRGLMLQSQKPPQQNFINDALQAIMRFKIRKLDALLAQNLEEIKKLESEKSDPAQIEKKVRLRMKITAFRNNLAQQLGTVVL